MHRFLMHTSCRTTRRTFLTAVAAAAAPLVVPGSALGLGGAVSANERISVGMIGSGERANQLTDHLLKLADAQIVAVCDPSQTKRESLRQRVEAAAAERREQGAFSGCADYNDFRDLLARDRTSTPCSLPRPKTGTGCMPWLQPGPRRTSIAKKPSREPSLKAKPVVKAVRENKCVFQIGHQQRHDPIFRLAVEMVQQGEIGDLRRIKVGVPPNRTGPIISPQPLPEGFDYDLWLGPAARQAISARTPAEHGVASHLRLRDWLHGGLGRRTISTLLSGPIRPISRVRWKCSASGVFPTEGICDCPLTWEASYRYANGVEMLFASEEKIPMGIRFEGSRARIYVNRARIECGPDSFQPVLQAKLPSDYQADVFRDASPAHVRNFLDCVKSRQDPITPRRNRPSHQHRLPVERRGDATEAETPLGPAAGAIRWRRRGQSVPRPQHARTVAYGEYLRSDQRGV